MWNAPQQVRNVTISSSRSPFANARICWDRSQTTTEWFRLDNSQLDTQAILTRVSYLDGQQVQEIITDIDNFIYTNESENLISVEGLSELRGDNYQSIISEADLVLENSTDRFTPKNDINIIDNPDFESFKNDWNIEIGASGDGTWDIVGGTENVVSGSNAIKINNPSADADCYLYSDTYSVSSGRAYTGSVFARGTGDIDLRVIAVGSGGSIVNSSQLTTSLSSGSFNRYEVTHSVPINATSAYIRFGTTSGVAIFDGAQLEQNNKFTSYNGQFIGDYILPKRPTKIEIEMLSKPTGSGGTVPLFAGMTENIYPNLKQNNVSIHCFDYATELQDKLAQTSASGMGMYQNLQSHFLIRELAYKAGLTDSDFTVESGKQVIPFAWFRDGSVWYYMQQIAEAEGGRVFFDEEGYLNFWNRDHLDENTTSQFTFTMADYILDMNYSVDKDKVKNHVVVKSNVREVQSNQSVWSSDGYIEIRPGENLEVWANINDQDGRDLPCTSLDEPEGAGATSTFTANTQSDGSGTDMTDELILLSWSPFATSAKMVFDNKSSQTLYITEIIIYGTPATITNEIEIDREDEDSINIYGEQVLQIENDYIGSENYAINLASDKLFNFKDPLNKVKIQVVGIPYLQIGDVVTLERGFGGDFEDMFITRNRWQILQNGDYIQNLDIEQRTIANFFILDTSSLDGTEVLQI